eukprot:764782-Hanusia_phi.AAC.11
MVVIGAEENNIKSEEDVRMKLSLRFTEEHAQVITLLCESMRRGNLEGIFQGINVWVCASSNVCSLSVGVPFGYYNYAHSIPKSQSAPSSSRVLLPHNDPWQKHRVTSLNAGFRLDEEKEEEEEDKIDEADLIRVFHGEFAGGVEEMREWDGMGWEKEAKVMLTGQDRVVNVTKRHVMVEYDRIREDPGMEERRGEERSAERADQEYAATEECRIETNEERKEMDC